MPFDVCVLVVLRVSMLLTPTRLNVYNDDALRDSVFEGLVCTTKCRVVIPLPVTLALRCSTSILWLCFSIPSLNIL